MAMSLEQSIRKIFEQSSFIDYDDALRMKHQKHPAYRNQASVFRSTVNANWQPQKTILHLKQIAEITGNCDELLLRLKSTSNSMQVKARREGNLLLTRSNLQGH
jgi:hypothetical protein